ncbi:MAG TPA: hypothetical protein VFH54_04760 [Mycobacteriales bacterium]|nr:hypothetical protein [Mycobacteriales bacterium]
MTTSVRPAFYALSTGRGGVRDWVTLLHPPYTAWHLAYVAIGAALAPTFAGWRLAGSLVAFFLAVGVAAHALDELHGRPLRTGIPASLLTAASVVGVVAPVVAGWMYGGLRLLPFIVAGAVIVVAYNLELARGGLHNTAVFALGWGAFPVLTGYYAQSFRLGWSAVVAAAAAVLLSVAQRELSSFVRDLRRRTESVDGRIIRADGTVEAVSRAELLRPTEAALRAMAAAVVLFAVALVISRLVN